jgi:hypothetical protein
VKSGGLYEPRFSLAELFPLPFGGESSYDLSVESR